MAHSGFRPVAALAVLFLVAHLRYLPPTLEDIDSTNFALGVRDFDVARHQPHPPGYPVFIGLAKISTPVVRAAGIEAPEVRAIALWSAVSGAGLVLLLFAFYRALDGSDRVAALATIVAATSPLFWFTALRPLSDTTGLAAAAAAQGLLCGVLGRSSRARPMLLWGAFLAGLAIGVRSQTFLLTLPLLGLVLAWPRTGLRLIDRFAAIGAVVLGGLAWGAPLVIASGGLESYMAALGTQAGEDFSGVVMLWNMRSVRVLADALQHSLLWPWGSPPIGAVILLVSAFGLVRAAWRRPLVVFVLAVAFVPYAVFHFLFHEVVTVRYALPLIVPLAWLFVYALEGLPRPVAPVGAAVAAVVFLVLALPRPVAPVGVAVAAVVFLVLALPASAAYGERESPTMAALLAADARAGEAAAGTAAGSRNAPGAAVAIHAVARRSAEWLAPRLRHRVLKGPHGYEWLTLVDQWRAHPGSRVWFVADPRRTDLALFDPRSRGDSPERFRWSFTEPPFVGGARPGNADLHEMRPPGWMLGRGWALTAEVAGITARENLGPHRAPAVAWIRAREAPAILMIGGRQLGTADDPPVRLSLDLDGRPLHQVVCLPGFFLATVTVRGSTPPLRSYVPLEVTARAADGTPREIPVKLEQFDLQSDGTPMIGLDSGWHEPEYDPGTGRSWRWMSERATLWVRPIDRDVTLVLAGESPRRYFDAAPTVRVVIDGREVGRFSPTSDFSQEIRLPAAALARAGGRVEVASDAWFAPGDRDGSADRRHLALRIYTWSVR